MREFLRFLAGCLLALGVADARAQSTSFTYQGQLLDAGAAANGSYDFRFTLHDAESGGGAVGSIVEKPATPVTHGLFAVGLDFGAGAFPGADRWLEISVRTNGAPSYTTLGGRQPVGTVPYAMRAAAAGIADSAASATTAGSAAFATTAGSANAAQVAVSVSGPVPAGQVAGTFSLAGTVANSATTATPANTPNAIVARDGDGGFAAGTVTATAFAGDGAGLTALNASALATGTVPLERLPSSVVSPVFSGPWAGDGSGLTNLPVASVVDQFGSVDFFGEFIPDFDLGSDDIAQIDAHEGNLVVVRRGGTVTATGEDLWTQSLVGHDVISAKISGNLVVALRRNGTVFLWHLQNLEFPPAPDLPSELTEVPALSGARAVALAPWTVYALLGNGTLVAWSHDEPGDPWNPLPGVEEVRSFAFDSERGLAVTAEGTVVAWGNPDFDPFGLGVVPPIDGPVVAVAIGASISLALEADGTVVSWGDPQWTTRIPGDLAGVVEIAARGNLVAWRLADGSVHWAGLEFEGTVPSPGDNPGYTQLASSGWFLAALRLRSEPLVPARLNGLRNDFQGLVSAEAFVGDGSQLYGLNAQALEFGEVPAQVIPSLDAAKIGSGVLHVDRIPLLDAGKIGTGAFAAARIPGLDASKITSGTFSAAGRVANSATTATSANTASAIVARDAAGGFLATSMTASGTVTAGSFAGVGTALTALDASRLTQGLLPDARLGSNIPRLNETMTLTADFRLSDNDLLFRSGSDTNHGLGWFGGSREFAQTDVDGPVLYGWAGGGLGTISGGTQRLALTWDQGNGVNLHGDVKVTQSLVVSNVSGSAPMRIHGKVSQASGHASLLVENTEKAGDAGPALRVIGRGNASEGALSVTAEDGHIAVFRKFGSTVAYLENNGTWRAAAFVITSDRAQKAGFDAVDPEAILARVSALPIQRWHYTNDPAATPHVGPMAQDFHAMFGVGADDRGIATVDADGVALAAIQALHRRANDLASENAALRARLDRLAARIEALAGPDAGGQ